MLTLIIAQPNDPPAKNVCDEFQKKGYEFIYLERYNIKQRISICLSSTTTPTIYIDIGKKNFSIHEEDINGIWWRLKPTNSAEIPGGISTIDELFRMHEWRHLLWSLKSFFNVNWVNDPDIHTQMSRKPIQLKLAAECQLSIPRTIISNDNYQISKWVASDSLAYKSLSSFTSEDSIIFTTKINKKDVLSMKKSIRLAPGIYQEYVKKDHELRVTIVGNQVFCCKIHSQNKESTKIDWRFDQTEEMFTLGEISTNTKLKLLDFHNRSGLKYAAYDFIVDYDGNEIFLECNPGGEWFWQEKLLGFNISECLVNIIAKNKMDLIRELE